LLLLLHDLNWDLNHQKGTMDWNERLQLEVSIRNSLCPPRKT